MKKVTSIKYHENSSSVRGVVPWRRIERQTDIQTDRQTDRDKEPNSPICKFTNTPKEIRDMALWFLCKNTTN